MFNEKAFRRALLDNDMTVSDMAEILEISPVTLYRKMQGKSDFYRNEIQTIKKTLNLESVEPIFFN